MPLTKVEDHAAAAVALLPAQFRKPGFEALISAMVRPLNSGEQDLFDLLLKRIVIADSVGAQLDALAGSFNLLRVVGQTDADFRTAILGEIRCHLSDGSVPALYEVCDRQITILDNQGPSTGFDGQVAEFSAQVCTFEDGDSFITTPNAVGEEYARRLNIAKSAGVYFTLEWYEDTTPNNWFQLDFSPMDDATHLFNRHALGAVDNQ